MKYGLLSMLRTPLKTALFLLLIAVLTAVLALGTGMWQSAERMLADADDTFLSAGEFVFTGGNYPDSLIFDPALFDAASQVDREALASIEGVLSFEESYSLRATLTGLSNWEQPYATVGIMLVEGGPYLESTKAYRCRTKEIYYADRDVEDRMVLFFSPEDDPDYAFSDGRRYLVFGEFTAEDGFFECFRPGDLSSIIAEAGGPQTSPFPPYLDVTDYSQADWDALWADERGAYLRNASEMFKTINGAVNLIATSDIQSVEAFHRGEVEYVSGGPFSAQDYSSGDACVVSEYIALKLDLSVGDEVEMSIHRAAKERSFYSSYWPEEGFAAKQSFRVAGIYRGDGRLTTTYLAAAGQPWLGRSDNDYTIARVVLENQRAAAYIARAEALLPEYVSLNFYDQGYEAAALPILSMRETAILITVICFSSSLVVLVFFAYLFVFRNARSAQTLLSLGSGAPRVWAYLLSGCAAISLFAAAVGGVAGYFLSGQVTQAVYQGALENALFDRRFSSSGYGILSGLFVGVPRLDPMMYVLTAATVVLSAMLLCALFAGQTIRAQSPRVRWKKQARARKPRYAAKHAASSRARGAALFDALPSASLRYAAKSIFRGGRRSLVVPLAVAAMLAFVCLFSGMRGEYAHQLDEVYESVPVTMRVTDYRGKRIDYLVIEGAWIGELEESGFIAKKGRSHNLSYHFDGILARADGAQDTGELDVVVIRQDVDQSDRYHEIKFGQRLRIDYDAITFCDALELTPEFAFAPAPQVDYADGYDESVLSDPLLTQENPVCFLPASLMAEHGVRLGDKVQITVFKYAHNRVLNPPVAFTVAGSFTGITSKDTVYVPLYDSLVFDAGGGETHSMELQERYHFYNMASEDFASFVDEKYQSVGFRLKNTSNMAEFKDWLSTRYSQVNQMTENRRWVVVDDAALYRTVESLQRYITYMNLLYPVVLFVAGLIGFLLSTLLLKSRGGEITIMRGVGGRRLGIFLAYFLEQFGLCLPGIAVGLAATALLLGGLSEIGMPAVLLFVLCYLAGASFAIYQTMSRSVLRRFAGEE